MMSKIFSLFFFSLIINKSCGETSNEEFRKIKVCVIGAGPAGLGTTRFLAEHLDQFEITVFEKAHEVGGLWLYTNKTGVDEHGYPVHSGAYKNMRTISPKEINTYPDWPEINGPNKSFASHEVILDYMKNYTDHFHLRKFIKLYTLVEKVSLTNTEHADKWKVEIKNLTINKNKEYLFDAVVVCTGTFIKPSIPKISGLENFQGPVLHSKSYRIPDDFRNKSVIVLGAGLSGIDISQDLIGVASKVYLSHNHDKLNLSKVDQIAGVIGFENGKFILKDNTSISADVLLFCTGYKYYYPFLDESTKISVHDDLILPLYKHIVNIHHPSMSFLGIPTKSTGILSFLTYSIQAQYVVSLLKGRVKLPSELDMLENSQSILVGKKNPHYLQDPWKYFDELASLGGFPSYPKYYKIAFNSTWVHRKMDIQNYRNYNYVISPDKNSVEVVKIENHK